MYVVQCRDASGWHECGRYRFEYEAALQAHHDRKSHYDGEAYCVARDSSGYWYGCD